jgi:hypothetical protein
MKREAVSGGALIAGALASMVTMVLQPTGSQLLADVQHLAPVGVAVHALGLTAIPVSFVGAIGLTRRLAADGESAVAALVAYGMASVAVMIAAVASGLLATGLASQMAVATDTERDLAGALFHYTGHINQVFAKVYVVASSVAILLWSASILANGRLARGAGVLGVVVGALALFAVVIGHLRLDVHGFGAVVLCDGIWMIVIGTLLIRSLPVAQTR